MFKRSANSARAHMARAILFALVVALPGAAKADPQPPLLMDPVYAERAPVTQVAGCAVTIAGLTDDRRAPETIGIVPGFRSIAAPADREAWLRSIIETGLRVRGFTPTVALAPEATPATAPDASTEAVAMDASAEAVAMDGSATPQAVAPGPDVLTIRVRLQSVWLASMGMNKTGSVVLHVSAAHGSRSGENYYRGEYVSPNWNNGRGEFNEHLDRTFAEALNTMAADLATMCADAP